MAIEIVSFPIQNGGSFHSYVRLPELVIPWSSLIVTSPINPTVKQVICVNLDLAI